MNWEAIGAVGEILGALAVVGTLAYLATQVRYAKATATDSNRLERASGVREMVIELAKNDSLRSAWITGAGLDDYFEEYASKFDIPRDDAERLEYMSLHFFWLHWGQFASSKDPQDIKELENVIKKQYIMPPIKYSWENSPVIDHLDPTFRSFVDTLLNSGAQRAIE